MNINTVKLTLENSRSWAQVSFEIALLCLACRNPNHTVSNREKIPNKKKKSKLNENLELQLFAADTYLQELAPWFYKRPRPLCK